MAANDAEMRAVPGLGEDLEQIAKDLAGLRKDLHGLTGDVKQLGADQLETMQNTVKAAAAELACAVRSNPLAAVAIALGAGFLYGVLTRR